LPSPGLSPITMDYLLTNEIRVLAIDPSVRGLGFAVLEGPDQLLDWGMKQATGDKNTECAKIVKQLIDQYRPHALAIENCTGDGSRRSQRVRALLEMIRAEARTSGVKILDFSPDRVREAFAPKRTS